MVFLCYSYCQVFNEKKHFKWAIIATFMSYVPRYGKSYGYQILIQAGSCRYLHNCGIVSNLVFWKRFILNTFSSKLDDFDSFRYLLFSTTFLHKITLSTNFWLKNNFTKGSILILDRHACY